MTRRRFGACGRSPRISGRISALERDRKRMGAVRRLISSGFEHKKLPKLSYHTPYLVIRTSGRPGDLASEHGRRSDGNRDVRVRSGSYGLRYTVDPGSPRAVEIE